MYMAGHNAPGVQFETFVGTTVLQAFHNNVLVLVSDKQVHPVNGGIRNEVQPILTLKSILPAHLVNLKKMRPVLIVSP